MNTRIRNSLLTVVMIAAGLGLQLSQASPAAAACSFSVTGMDHTVGFLAGGTSATIAGTGFSCAGTLSVSFGSTAATIGTVTDTSIAVTSPAGSLGQATVTVALGSPTSASGAVPTKFTYVSPPAITGIVPAKGPEAGGTDVHVTGTDFSPAGSTTAVKFGTNASPTVSSVTATTLTAASPAGTATKNVTVIVSLPGGATATSNGEPFVYVPAPTVTSVSPGSGSVLGGTDVTVTGTGFQPGANVLFGPSDGSGPPPLPGTTQFPGDAPGSVVSVLSATSILVTTRPGIVGATNVVVINPDSQFGVLKSSAASPFSFTGTAPTVTGVAASSGTSLGGTHVTISGTGFLQGASAIFSSSTDTSPPAGSTTAVAADGTSMSVTTPAHAAGAVTVTVDNVGGGTASLASAYTFNAAAAPTVSSVAAATGGSLGGTQITVTGTNFASGAKVQFGTTAAASAAVLNATTIVVTTPAHPGSSTAVAVTVTNPDGQSASEASAFTFTAAAAPVVTSVTPTTGLGGTQIAIVGTGFANTNGGATNAAAPAVVQVGTAACVAGYTGADSTCLGPVPATGTPPTSPPVVVSSTSINGIVPNAKGGAVTITITNPDGQTATHSFTYSGFTGSPTVTAISPATGPSLGNTSVTITGTNFNLGAVVAFAGSSKAASVVVASDGTSITARTPAGLYGTVDVTVTNPGGDVTTLTDGFEFTTSPAPTITSISPASDPAGTEVTITGTGFANTNGGATNSTTGATVTIAGQPLLPLAPTGTPPTSPALVTSATTIVGIVPANPGGTYDVGVLNPDGQGAILVGGYTYPADTTAPTTVATGLVGTSPYTFNTWATGHVVVNLTGTDSGSGLKSITYSATGAQPIALTTVPVTAPGTSASFTITAEGTTTLTFFSTDIAGNQEASHTAVVKVDTIHPAVTTTATIPSGGGTTAFASGAFTNQNVTVSFSCSDGGSGVSTLTSTASSGSTTTTSGTDPLAVTVTSVGTAQSVTGVCTDAAGNQTASTFSGINIVRTAPVITTAAFDGGQVYVAGTWVHQNVTVTFSCTPLSAGNQVVTLTGPVQVAGPIQNGTVAGTCVDAAGNSSTVTFGTASSGIDIDLTLPTVTAAATTTNNLGATVPYTAGTWTDHNVVVTFTCTDPGAVASGVASVTSPVTVSAEGDTSAVVGNCADAAGNTANPPAFFGPILIDKTPPTCSAFVVPSALSPANGKLVKATATVNTADNASGVHGFVLTSVTSNNPSTAANDILGFVIGTASTAGQLRSTKGRVYTFAYQASDVAGNVSALCTAVVKVS